MVWSPTCASKNHIIKQGYQVGGEGKEVTLCVILPVIKGKLVVHVITCLDIISMKLQHTVVLSLISNVMTIYFLFSLSFLLQGDNYGINWDGPVPNNPTDDRATVEVPVTGNPLREEDYALLRGSIDPLRE